MSNKLIATLATIATLTTAAIPFFSTPASAIFKVQVLKNCMSYNDKGEVVSTVRPDYYPLIEYGQFQDGKDFAKISVEDNGNQNSVNIPFHCLNHDGEQVREY